MSIIFKNKIDLQKKLLKLSNIQNALRILKAFSKLKGVKNPILAGGYIRELILGGKQNDLDMLFMGTMSREKGYEGIKKIENDLNTPHLDWHITNKQHGGYKNSEEAVANNGETVTCIGLTANGRLIDPTGYGLKDIQSKTLRLPISSVVVFSTRVLTHTPLVMYAYFAMRAVRFISAHNFKPDQQTDELIKLLGALAYSVEESEKIKYLTKLKKNTPNHKKTIALLKKYGMDALVPKYSNIKI